MRLASILVILGLVVSAFAFAEGAKEESNTIGVSKIVSHPALDAVEQGLMDELGDRGYEYEYDLQNANGDMTTATSIANKFKNDRVRLAVGIATPTSQALVNSLTEIPVVYSAVTDPVDAGLVDSYERGGRNVTGVSDMTPVREQIAFLQEVAGIETLGHVYSSGEANAVTLAEMARAAADELGIDFVEATVTNSAEVRQAAQSIAGRVDAFYVSTDNTVVSALSALVEVADNAGIPVMSADPSSAEEYGVLAAWGFDYYQVGRATGRIIAQVIEGTPTSEIPTKFMTDPEDVNLLLNLDVAERVGIDFDQETVDRATTLVRDGELVRQ